MTFQESNKLSILILKIFQTLSSRKEDTKLNPITFNNYENIAR